jgi:hypothetical protein
MRKRFDAGAWAVLGVTAGWWVLTLTLSLMSLAYPSDGWTIRRDSLGGTIRLNSYFHLGPTPLREDDKVLAIEGQTLGSDGTAPVGPDTQAGQVLRYTLEREIEGEPQRLEVPVTLATPGPASFGAIVLRRLSQEGGYLTVATVGFVVTLAAFLVRPGNLGARFLLLTYSYYCPVQWAGFNTSELYLPVMPSWLVGLGGVVGLGWVWFFFPSMTLVALSFPVVKGPLRRFPRLLPAVLYGLPGAGSVMGIGASVGLLGDFDWEAVGNPLFIGVIAVMVLTLATALVHNWLTLREAVTRAQLRWVTLGLALGLGLPFGWLLLGLVLSGSFPTSDVMLWAQLGLPVCLAIAITRYRLWDIDVIIRRTLTYSVLTAVLGLAYLGSVLVLQPVLARVTGQATELANVLSTLAVAALFGPVRVRVQRAIDIRFYRKKYDAARTLAGFGAAARDVVELEQLSGQLLRVVEETMQPQRVSLWLRQPGPPGTPRTGPAT